MTLPVFSMKNKPLRHAFRVALKEGMILGMISTLLFSGMLVLPIAALFANNPSRTSKIIFYMGSMEFPEPILLLIVLSAVVQALFSFPMLYRRDSAGFYFGIGLSRSQLFGARFAAGMTWQTVAVLVAIAGGVAVNLAQPDYKAAHTGLLLGNSLIVGFGMLLTALIAFSVTTLVCALVGTLAEAIVYALLALLLPTFFFFGLNGQMVAFLWGNAHDVKNIWGYYNLPDNLVVSLQRFNPLFYFSEPFAAYGSPRIAGQMISAEPVWSTLLGWLLAAAILVWLARHFFIRRPVEKTGLRGTCKSLGFILILPLIYAICSYPLYRSGLGLAAIPVSTAVAIGIGLAAAVFLGLAFPLRLLIPAVWKGLLAFPVYLIIVGISSVILLAGGLGYRDYQPKVEDVTRVSISYKGIPNLVLGDSYGYGGGLININNNRQLTLDAPEDVKMALALHRRLIDQGGAQTGRSISSYTLVQYTLQNGRQVSRFYSTATRDVLDSMLSLDDTMAFQELFRGYMNGIDPKAENPEQPCLDASSPFSQGVLYLTSPLSDRLVLLDKEFALRVRRTLAEDVANQSIEDRYKPSVPENFTLYFYLLEDIYHVESNGYTDPQIIDLNRFNPGFLSWINIDSSCPKTLMLLTAISREPETKGIESIQVIGPYWDILMNVDHQDLEACFSSNPENPETIDSMLKQAKITPGVTTYDPNRIDELFKASRGFYFAGDNGYLILIKLHGSKTCLKRYIPRAELPEWAK